MIKLVSEKCMFQTGTEQLVSLKTKTETEAEKTE
jgi:hypothetical protein